MWFTGLGGAVVLFAGQPASVSYWESALCEAVFFLWGSPAAGRRGGGRGATACVRCASWDPRRRRIVLAAFTDLSDNASVLQL